MDNDGLIGDIALVVRLLNSVFSLLSSLRLLRILALLLAPLDEDVAEKDKAAAANHRANDDGALRASSHVITAVTVAVAVAARSAARAEASAAASTFQYTEFLEQPEIVAVLLKIIKVRRRGRRFWLVL